MMDPPRGKKAFKVIHTDKSINMCEVSTEHIFTSNPVRINTLTNTHSPSPNQLCTSQPVTHIWVAIVLSRLYLFLSLFQFNHMRIQ